MKIKSPEIRIRRMEERDVPGIIRIEQQNFPDPWKPENFEYYLDRENAIFLTAELGTEEAGGDISGKTKAANTLEIAGYIGLITAADEGDITNVSVAPGHQGCGIGTRLLNELLSRADAGEIRKIFLEVRESNAPAIRLYSKYSFRKIGIRKRYYTDPDEDAVLMCRLRPDI